MVWDKTLRQDVELFGPKTPYQMFENFSSFSFLFFVIFYFVHPAVVILQIIFVFILSFSFHEFLRSSSHLLLGLPTCLLALTLVSSPGCQLNTLLFHLFTGWVMILRAIRHFCLLGISIQHFILCFSMCSSASFVIFLMYSIQSSSNFFIGVLLERHIAVLVFVRVLLRALFRFFVSQVFFAFFISFSVPSSFLSIFTFSVCTFVSVCTIRRSIFRCAVLIIFSCFCVNVHVLLA